MKIEEDHMKSMEKSPLINECMEWGMQDDVKCVGVRCVNLRFE
jgi:hypothetical protein